MCCVSIEFYIITQVILAFRLDLSEDIRTIDVISTKFFLQCFKMKESYENLENDTKYI